MVSQLLSTVLDGRSLLWIWSPWIDGLWIGGWALAGSLGVGWGRSRWLRILIITGLMITLVGICYGVLLLGGWIPLLPAVFSLALSSLGSALWLPISDRQRDSIHKSLESDHESV
jgi:CHASE2 domain-containing sensor protein